jgi:hypothetical protein
MNAQMHLTADGDRLLKNWKHTRDHVSRLEEELRKAKADLVSTTDAFGKWLTPPDAGNGEVFYVWMGDSLIGAQRMSLAPLAYEVKVRYKGKEWNTL